nr:ankyrin-2-like [Crassostrea gigas]
MKHFRLYSLMIVHVITVLHVSAEYSFNVHQVEKCPMSKGDWDTASAQLKCNRTHGYHCVPNKQFTSLIEFCYPKGYKFPYEAGHCLELAASGILNQVPCTNTFDDGCPENHFFSDEIFKYPKCLMINKRLKCFEADHGCIYLGVLKHKQFEENVTTTGNSIKDTSNKSSNITTECRSTAVVVALAILLGISVSAQLITCVFIYCKGLGRCKHLRYDTVLLQDRFDFESDSYNPRNSKANTQYKGQSVQTEHYNYKHYYDDSAIEEEEFLVGVNMEEYVTEKETIRKLHGIIVDGEEQKFEILRSQYSKDKYEKLNSRGFNSLHLSAKCGNLKIFKEILKCNVDIETVTTDGRNSLHIAAFYGSPSICKYILENRKDLFDIADRYNMNSAHWAALAGQDSILELLSENGCNISVRTPKYEENIVLFACIGESYNVLKLVGSNEHISSLLYATNSEGWNSIQYAAKSGNLKVFKYLCDKGVTMHNRPRQTGKNCLHTACEKGNIEICRYILKERKDKTLITQTDKHEQHVGHFAAKGGNTDILTLLMEHFSVIASPHTDFFKNPTIDNINILHIACRHARFDMCVKIADTFPDLINEITEKGWNAALFITEKAGAERERIEILHFLEKRKLNVYHVSRSGKTILYNACANRSGKLVKHLLSRYPDLMNIEKSMDPRKASKSIEIEELFRQHLEDKFV